MKILAYELKTRKILVRQHTFFLIALNSHKETKYEETCLINVLEIFILRNIAYLHYNLFAVKFESVDHCMK